MPRTQLVSISLCSSIDYNKLLEKIFYINSLPKIKQAGYLRGGGYLAFLKDFTTGLIRVMVCQGQLEAAVVTSKLALISKGRCDRLISMFRRNKQP